MASVPPPPSGRPVRVLILTAAFGEGHNTAARSVSEALRLHGDAEVSVVDVYQRTVPKFTRLLQSAYGFAINKLPSAWSLIFDFLDKPGRLEATLPLASNLRDAVREELRTFRPDVILSTYPLYAYLVRELRSRGEESARVPLVTVVTDSTAINSSWYRGGSEVFAVADEETASVLRHGGIDPSRIRVLGFPVAPRFAALRPLAPEIHGAVRILYMPSSKIRQTLAVTKALLGIPGTEVTVVTGRLASLHAALERSGIFDGKRAHLVGWTDKVPELLCSHHLYIGKAGGAIVQEAVASRCPILVSHVVPGQEEGNIEMIERHGIGRLAAHYPTTIAASVEEAFASGGATWKGWKANLASISRPDASVRIAEFLVQTARNAQSGG